MNQKTGGHENSTSVLDLLKVIAFVIVLVVGGLVIAGIESPLVFGYEAPHFREFYGSRYFIIPVLLIAGITGYTTSQYVRCVRFLFSLGGWQPSGVHVFIVSGLAALGLVFAYIYIGYDGWPKAREYEIAYFQSDFMKDSETMMMADHAQMGIPNKEFDPSEWHFPRNFAFEVYFWGCPTILFSALWSVVFARRDQTSIKTDK